MIKSITINIAVKDLTRSTAFFQKVGFNVNPLFASEPEMELIDLSDALKVMLNSEPRFSQISRKAVADAGQEAEVIFQLRVGSRKEVDEFVDRALGAGGRPIHEPNEGEFVYGRSFTDLDNHNWDFFWASESDGGANS